MTHGARRTRAAGSYRETGRRRPRGGGGGARGSGEAATEGALRRILSGGGPADPLFRDALEFTRFAMAAMREGDKARAGQFLSDAMRALQ